MDYLTSSELLMLTEKIKCSKAYIKDDVRKSFIKLSFGKLTCLLLVRNHIYSVFYDTAIENLITGEVIKLSYTSFETSYYFKNIY